MNDTTPSDSTKPIPSFPFQEMPAVPTSVAASSATRPGVASTDELERLRQSLDSAVQEALSSFHAYLAALGGQNPAVANAVSSVLPFIEPMGQRPAESFPSRFEPTGVPSSDAKESKVVLSATLQEKLEKGLIEAFAAEPKSVLPPPKNGPAKAAPLPPPLPESIPPVTPIVAAAPALITSPFSTVEPPASPFAVVPAAKKTEPEPVIESPFVRASVPVAAPLEKVDFKPVGESNPPLPTPPPLPPGAIGGAPAAVPFAVQPPVAPPPVAPIRTASETPAPPVAPPPVAAPPAHLPFSPFQGLEPAPPPPLLDKAPATPPAGGIPPIIAENAPAWSPPRQPSPPPVFAAVSTPAIPVVTAEAKGEKAQNFPPAAPASVITEELPPVPSFMAKEELAVEKSVEKIVESAPFFGSTQATTAPFRLGDVAAPPPSSVIPPATSSFNPFALPKDEDVLVAKPQEPVEEKPLPTALESTPPATPPRLTEPTEAPSEIAFNFAEMLRSAGQRPS